MLCELSLEMQYISYNERWFTVHHKHNRPYK